MPKKLIDLKTENTFPDRDSILYISESLDKLKKITVKDILKMNSIRCQSCGAPNRGAGKCEYCGT